MGSVTPISTTKELERFFDCLYGDQKGFVYSPTKNPEVANSWEQHFFLWPQDKERLVRHVHSMSARHEVYVGPALFKLDKLGKPSGEKESFLGSHYVWAEFDGNASEAITKLPSELSPAMRIQSSLPGHEHWYWRLEGFVEDIAVIESITQRLAYHLDGDIGCWNANRVLRPPTTVHHESRKSVTVLKSDLTPTPIAAFIKLPELPVRLVDEIEVGTIPAVFDVVAKYVWPEDMLRLFKESELATKEGKDAGKGFRNEALTKLGYFCLELGMTTGEALAVLLNADNRWKKFHGRKDQMKQLLSIMNYCRSRKSSRALEEAAKPPTEEQQEENRLVSQFKIYTWREFKEAEVNVEWLIDDYLHKKGFGVVSGPPGVGKSQYSLRFAEAMAKGLPYLKWPCPRPVKTLFISLEMPWEELDHISNVMKIEDPDGALHENLFVMPVGSTIKLADEQIKNMLASSIDQINQDIDIVMIDSLGHAVGDELNSDKVIFDSFRFVHNYIRSQLGAAMWFIHHPRKEQAGNRKPKEQDDLYGSRYISAAATSITNLWPMDKKGHVIELSCLKMRLASKFDKFTIKRTPGLDFQLGGEVIETTQNEGFFTGLSDEDEGKSNSLIDSI